MATNPRARATRGRVIGTYGMKCAWCGEPIEVGDLELHHWLIKRGMMPRKDYELINVVINVVPLHRSCHKEFGQTKDMEARCFKLVASVYGNDEIRKFKEAVYEVSRRS